jgi:hypothetical protein
VYLECDKNKKYYYSGKSAFVAFVITTGDRGSSLREAIPVFLFIAAYVYNFAKN